MTYVTLKAWGKSLDIGRELTIEVQCNVRQALADSAGGYAINFQQDRSSDINGVNLHFKPIGPSSTVVLNTLSKGKWGQEVQMQDENVKMIYFENPFKLKLKAISKDTVHVYVNDKFKAEYVCTNNDITETRYIVFPPFVSIHPL
ncbi:Hypothetical predicted protein [Mytilus galloprovincialis]|nr:Hypothetical predicted protein [Mytilus galloprovincialis]